MIQAVWMPISRGEYVLVDRQDIHLFDERKWTLVRAKRAGAPTYAYRAILGNNKRKEYLHRVIMSPPDGYVVDHINGDTLDNRRSNLRVCTKSQNMRNNRRANKWKGISFQKPRTKGHKPKWKAYIATKENGRCHMISLGRFDDPIDAAKAYNVAAVKYYGEYACLNDLSLSPPVVPSLAA